MSKIIRTTKDVYEYDGRKYDTLRTLIEQETHTINDMLRAWCCKEVNKRIDDISAFYSRYYIEYTTMEEILVDSTATIRSIIYDMEIEHEKLRNAIRLFEYGEKKNA